MEELTRREIQVLRAIAHGRCRIADISSELGISPRTVAVHRVHIYKKLGIGSSGEAVLIALQMGLNEDFRYVRAPQ